MSRSSNPLNKFVLYPFLFGLFPVLSLLGHNAQEVQLSAGFRSIVFTLFVVTIVLAVSKLIFRTWDRSAVWTSALLLILLSYGHIYHALRAALPFGLLLIRHRFLASFLLLGFLGFSYWLLRRENWGQVRFSLNTISVFLLFIPLIQVGQAAVRSVRQGDPRAVVPEDCRFSISGDEQPPDIYYIILDAYARNDVMQRTYGFDNQPFLDQLHARGFYIADWAQSNYARTGISLDSSLNMSYFDLSSGEPVLTEQEHYTQPLSIGNNVVRKELACLGYQVIAFDSGYYWSGWRDADFFLSPVEGTDRYQIMARVNPFESLLIYNSAGLLALDASTVWLRGVQEAVNEPMALHLARVKYALDQAGSFVPKLDSPKFAFVHIVSPHPPFVLGYENEASGIQSPFTFQTLTDYGESISEVEGYRSQVLALNERVLRMVDQILAQSERQPVIILQGDHGTGSGMNDRMSILSAYYLPEGGEVSLYPTITPVNTFRVIFRTYFDSTIPLLEDHTYFSQYESLFELTEIPNPHAED
jgi:hypothetical protein